jgi:uncharacterized membrane protein YgdD (TMEM256/DUF423 family)
MKNNKSLITIAIFGASAVIIGAFGAHSLKNQLSSGLITQEQLNGFDTGVKYQMYHTLALLALFILKQQFQNKFLNFSWYFFVGGIILFSGSLYLLTTRNLYNADCLKMLGPITPIGGLLFVAGWLMLIFASFNKSPKT